MTTAKHKVLAIMVLSLTHCYLSYHKTLQYSSHKSCKFNTDFNQIISRNTCCQYDLKCHCVVHCSHLLTCHSSLSLYRRASCGSCNAGLKKCNAFSVATTATSTCSARGKQNINWWWNIKRYCMTEKRGTQNWWVLYAICCYHISISI